MAKTIRMQTRRWQISSEKWTEVLVANARRRFLDISISTSSLVLPTNPGVVKMAFDSSGEQYKLVWVLRPFQPHLAPGNAVQLQALKEDPMGPEVTVTVEVTEGIEVDA
ncbi:MAG: hypothetical protein ACK4UT_00745 [Moraxellaceae bacterium]